MTIHTIKAEDLQMGDVIPMGFNPSRKVLHTLLDTFGIWIRYRTADGRQANQRLDNGTTVIIDRREQP